MARLSGARVKPATGATTNATPTAISLIDLLNPALCEAIDNQGGGGQIYAVARHASSGATAFAIVPFVFKRLSGTLTLIESGTATLLGLADLNIAAVAVQASGDVLQALVTGIAATNINWTVHTTLWTD